MLTTWDAVSTLDRMFDDVMGSMLGTATNARTFEPSIDVRSSESEVVFVCDAPGVKQDDLEVTVENHVLTIKGTRKFESREDEQVMLGRAYGSFARAYSLPDYLDDVNLSANLADGVLTVRIPKHAQAKPRKIQISNGSSAKQLKE
jgi:HSP20 family protein